VQTPGGGLLLGKGHLVSTQVLERLKNIAWNGGVAEPLRVWQDDVA
jgi:hypothetical protein